MTFIALSGLLLQGLCRGMIPPQRSEDFFEVVILFFFHQFLLVKQNFCGGARCLFYFHFLSAHTTTGLQVGRR